MLPFSVSPLSSSKINVEVSAVSELTQGTYLLNGTASVSEAAAGVFSTSSVSFSIPVVVAANGNGFCPGPFCYAVEHWMMIAIGATVIALVLTIFAIARKMED